MEDPNVHGVQQLILGNYIINKVRLFRVINIQLECASSPWNHHYNSK